MHSKVKSRFPTASFEVPTDWKIKTVILDNKMKASDQIQKTLGSWVPDTVKLPGHPDHLPRLTRGDINFYLDCHCIFRLSVISEKSVSYLIKFHLTLS